MVFLTADAFGVLPPVSKLTPEQAMFHFMSGYTAKVAGTEAGVTEPQATFSTCFGAPFMPLPPKVYAEMLGRRLREHGAQCWLVNTGWQGGPYGVGKRMSLPYTRAMVNALVEGKLANVEFEIEPAFGLSIPTFVPGSSLGAAEATQFLERQSGLRQDGRRSVSAFREELRAVRRAARNQGSRPATGRKEIAWQKINGAVQPYLTAQRRFILGWLLCERTSIPVYHFARNHRRYHFPRETPSVKRGIPRLRFRLRPSNVHFFLGSKIVTSACAPTASVPLPSRLNIFAGFDENNSTIATAAA